MGLRSRWGPGPHTPEPSSGRAGASSATGTATSFITLTLSLTAARSRSRNSRTARSSPGCARWWALWVIAGSNPRTSLCCPPAPGSKRATRARDALVDGVVETHVEVQERDAPRRRPSSRPKSAVVSPVESARRSAAPPPPREDDLDSGRPSLSRRSPRRRRGSGTGGPTKNFSMVERVEAVHGVDVGTGPRWRPRGRLKWREALPSPSRLRSRPSLAFPPLRGEKRAGWKLIEHRVTRGSSHWNWRP